jgi:AraC family transcriptional regulator
MEPRIVRRPALTLVGFSYRGRNQQNEIANMWRHFNMRVGDIKQVVDRHIAYGVMDNYDEESGEFDYLAAVEVAPGAPIPAGMTCWHVPAQIYAVFGCAQSSLLDTYDHIYDEWLPASAFVRDFGPEFELYDSGFDPDDPESPLCLFVPVVTLREAEEAPLPA